mmetsp:Transcript_27844/g.52484  ORF Transcript_27844/g.52484 Transcript_27844/m.52484 type:complete len:85 (+) Transcript_27844:209-463(+)
MRAKCLLDPIPALLSLSNHFSFPLFFTFVNVTAINILQFSIPFELMHLSASYNIPNLVLCKFELVLEIIEHCVRLLLTTVAHTT